jgi:hypothetical protein
LETVIRPRDIERALAEDLDADRRRRDLQREAAAHVRVQRAIDERFARGELGESASVDTVAWIHREFCHDAAESMLTVERPGGVNRRMEPGAFRSRPEQDNVVGRHQPPSSEAVLSFMDYFERRFALKPILGAKSRGARQPESPGSPSEPPAMPWPACSTPACSPRPRPRARYLCACPRPPLNRCSPGCSEFHADWGSIGT